MCIGKIIKRKILIGSTALHQHLGDTRQPKDTDWFCLSPSDDKETFYHEHLKSYAWQSDVASLDELYTIKVSHIFWDLGDSNWMKHAYDITQMERAQAKWIPELHGILYPIWEERYGHKNVSLQATADEFFNAHVTRVYDHDSIHASIAYYDKPLFNAILKDNEEVAVSREKFEALPLDDKFKLVREEIYATALERVLIPNDYKASPRQAYHWALKKTLTSFSKGWFPLFIALHLDELRSADIDYKETHLHNQEKLIPLGEAK